MIEKTFPKKKLPIFISNFKEMIEDNYLYIDKTEYIYDLVKEKGYYFLSRPRRFGKSLLVSTLKELFLGNKKLFEKLWIGSTDYTWQEHPVIHLDFSIIDHETAQELKISLEWKLKTIAQEYNVDISQAPTLGSMLETLVVQLSKKNKVVILIDEYDKPILDHVQDIERAKKQRDVLKNFYGTIKGLDPYLRCVFLTGVTRFSKTSIFSGINNLNDLSLKPEAAQLLGYTQEELQTFFLSYIQDLAQIQDVSTEIFMHEIKKWYNGYRFSEQNSKVYNPFSILYCFKDKKLHNYWFESGTPTFLIHLLKIHSKDLQEITGIEIDRSSLGSFEIDKIPLVPLLFQAGYLTIADYNPQTDIFTLHYPNQEVAESFTKYLLATLTKTDTSTVKRLSIQLINALQEKNIDQFCSLVQTFFAHIPYLLHIKRESFYHALFQALVTLLSIEAHSEILTDKGRIDLVIALKKTIFIFEFKFNSSADIALQQIKDRGYYERYMHKNKEIMLIGLAFNDVNDQILLEHKEEVIIS
jgi:hypothetical protein